MSIRVACPFCNTSAVLPARPPTGRTVCPRCGETFPVKAAEDVEDPVEPSNPPGADVPRSDSYLPSRTALLLSCGVAVLLLGVGLYFYRPFADPPPGESPNDARPPGTTPPAALAGLRYLPAGADVVFAVQPAALVAYAERAKADPKALLAAAGVPAEVTAALDRAGLPLDQIDHLAGGASIDAIPPPLTVVLKLRRPVADEERFLQNLRAEKKAKAGRPTYAVTAGLPLTMTKIDDRTYLFGLTENDLAAADAPPAEAPLSADLRAGLGMLSPASFAWVATGHDRWADKAVVKTFLAAAKDPKGKERAAKLGLFRQAAVGVSLEPDPRLKVAVKTADADSAGRLREYFAEKLAAERAVVGGLAEWAEADVPFDPKSGGDVVRRLLADVR